MIAVLHQHRAGGNHFFSLFFYCPARCLFRPTRALRRFICTLLHWRKDTVNYFRHFFYSFLLAFWAACHMIVPGEEHQCRLFYTRTLPAVNPFRQFFWQPNNHSPESSVVRAVNSVTYPEPAGRSADFQSAVSQNSILQNRGRFGAPARVQRPADYKSAIQQRHFQNLRWLGGSGVSWRN